MDFHLRVPHQSYLLNIQSHKKFPEAVFLYECSDPRWRQFLSCRQKTEIICLYNLSPKLLNYGSPFCMLFMPKICYLLCIIRLKYGMRVLLLLKFCLSVFKSCGYLHMDRIINSIAPLPLKSVSDEWTDYRILYFHLY